MENKEALSTAVWEEIIYDSSADASILLKEKFDNIAKLIIEKIGDSYGVVCVNGYNYALFAASTTANFNYTPLIRYGKNIWMIIQDDDLPHDKILVLSCNKSLGKTPRKEV